MSTFVCSGSPYNDVVQGDRDSEPQHRQGHQAHVGGDLGGVRRGERHGRQRALRAHGARQTRARARLQLLARGTRGAAHARALARVPHSPDTDQLRNMF